VYYVDKGSILTSMVFLFNLLDFISKVLYSIAVLLPENLRAHLQLSV
jgi:hypothetical protein